MTTLNLILLVIATLLVGFWCFLAIKYSKEFEVIIDSIDTKLYRYPEIFSVGFGLLKMFRFDGKSERARKRIKEIAEVRGKKYSEYYYYVMNGAKYSYGYTILTFFAVLGALANSGLALLFGAILAGLIVWFVEELLNDQLDDRRDELLADLPQMLSKLTLLVNSGMIVREAWEKVAYGSERVLYKEMQFTVSEMRNGVSDLDSFRNFADRCAVKEIRRFSSTMIQNIQKGNAELAYFLKEMSDDMWEEKKHMVKRKGETANSKLLIPIGMIFVGILIMIIVPAFLSM